MIKVGIIGATGYAGSELVRILLGHKDVEIKWYGSRSYIDKKYASIYQNFFQLVDANCMDDNMEVLADQVDVIFTATPQGLCASLVNEEILSKVKIIDLSADFRIKDVKVYEEWYKLEHKSGMLYNLQYPDLLSAGKRRHHRSEHDYRRCKIRYLRCRTRCESGQSVLRSQ